MTNSDLQNNTKETKYHEFHIYQRISEIINLRYY